MRRSGTVALALTLALSLLVFLPVHAAVRYTPRQNDYFNYHETIDLNQGGGTYQGYTEHQDIDGKESMNTVYSNGTVATHYSYSWSFSNSSGSQTSGNWAGDFSYSSTNFHYQHGTDNQTGYTNPYVWFYMDNTLPNGATLWLLNTQMTVTSTDTTYHLTVQNKYVHAISAKGSSSYNRNDVYGKFTAQYTWTVYFDASTGYIIAYDYVENDVNGAASFTWTENLQASSTSYPLASAPVPISDLLAQNALLIAGIVFLVLFLAIIVVVARRAQRKMRALPEHPSHQQPFTLQPQYNQSNPPIGSPQYQQGVNLTPPQQPPVQQIVVKEVVKVKCRYCGALIDGTAQQCPFCGAPRT